MKKIFVPLFIVIVLAQTDLIFAFDITPPSVPRGFDAAGSTSYQMVLTWTNPADSDLDHINIYLSSTGGYSSPNVLTTVAATPNTKGTYTISNLSASTNYFFYLAAVDSSGNKSVYTVERQRTIATSPDKTSPAAVANQTAKDLATDGAIALSWANPSDDDFFQTRVYRGITSDFSPDSTNAIAAVFGLPSSAGAYNDSSLTNGTTYYYKLRTEDNRGNLQTGLFYPSTSVTPTKAVVVTPPPTITQSTASPATTTTPAPLSLVDTQGNAIVDGDTIKTSDSLDVYIVKLTGTKKFRRLILNPDVFNSYGQLSWSTIKTVSQDVMNAYTISTLVIEVNADGSIVNPKVFSLTSSANADIGEKHWLNMTAAQFELKKYDWDSIYRINHNEAGIYGHGSDILGS